MNNIGTYNAANRNVQWPTTSYGDMVSPDDDNATIAEMKSQENNNPVKNRITALDNLFSTVKSQIDAIYGTADWFAMQNDLYCIQLHVEECIQFVAHLESQVVNHD